MSKAIISTSPLRTVLGQWRSVSASTTSSSADIDLEAQTVVGSRVHLPVEITTPPAAYTHAPHSLIAEEGSDPVDDFFGVTRSSSATRAIQAGTQSSRHDSSVVPAHYDNDEAAPPPYADASALPSYAAVAEPPTLAMYLFKFGFLFPLFWLAGSFILLSPLHAPQDWETSKTEAERQELIELLRRIEKKWARRCLIAFSVLALIILVVVLIAMFARRH